MLYGLFVGMYVLLSCFLALIILVQRSKGSTGFGAFSGGTQLLFGGSGGQDVLQKVTWVLGALFLASSLFMSLHKTKQAKTFRYLTDTVSSTQPIAKNMETTTPSDAASSESK